MKNVYKFEMLDSPVIYGNRKAIAQNKAIPYSAYSRIVQRTIELEIDVIIKQRCAK